MFPDILAANDKYPVLNRGKLTIPIQMQFDKKQIIFSQFFAALLKSRLDSEHFGKKMILIDFTFRKLQIPKMWLHKCLKNPVAEDPLTSNMVNRPKHC